MLVVTAREMRELDRLTIEKYGVPSLTLMERAGASVADAVLRDFRSAARKGVLVVAGKGNNGGDGLVVARHLKRKGIRCEVVVLAKKGDLTRDAAANLRSYLKLNGKVFALSGDDVSLLQERFAGKGVLVDAIFGTGLKEEVKPPYRDAIHLMNGSGLPTVAVDIPSGLDADRGRPLGTAVQAEMTVALGFPKLGEVISPGVTFSGDLVVADIGIHPKAVEEVNPQTELLEDREVGWLIPSREPDTHKGTYGHLLVMAGSRGKTGAAVLSSRSAMRVGTGLVTLAAARSLNDIFATCLIEAMTEPLKDNSEEQLEPVGESVWRRIIERKSALLFGPGIGVNDACRDALRWLLRNLPLPWVIDADGLTNLVDEKKRLRGAKSPPVLTPHPGEMARLLGITTEAVADDRVGIARSFAKDHRCYLVLKGARTVIGTPEGRALINPTGNAGMATGGMGDVLAGILAGLLAQGMKIEDALRLGVFLHGFVGDRIAEERGEMGLLASDLVEGLPFGLKQLSAISRLRSPRNKSKADG